MAHKWSVKPTWLLKAWFFCSWQLSPRANASDADRRYSKSAATMTSWETHWKNCFGQFSVQMPNKRTETRHWHPPPLFGQHLFAAVHVQVFGLAAASGTACRVKSRHFVEIVEVSIAPVLCKRSLFKTAACRSCKQVQVVGIYSFHKFGHSNLWRETILQLNLPYLPNTHLWHSVHHESLCAISFDMRKI